MSKPVSTTPDNDPAYFMKIAGQGASVSTHADLWRWLQGDVQQWLSHEVMLIGWGDFRTGDLQYDIVSSLPGMRSHDWTSSSVAPLVSYFRDCWVAAQKQPCQMDISGCGDLVRVGSPEPRAIATVEAMQTALVHGIDGHVGGERIFAALSLDETPPAGSTTALKLLLPFIDTALRRMPPVPARQSPCERLRAARHAVPLTSLSDRERQIMTWVAMGKTNPEIGCILEISEFTVKNHMKSIFAKLDVTNRAQAVAKLSEISVHA
jgi:transcriptional regulator EpsA